MLELSNYLDMPKLLDAVCAYTAFILLKSMSQTKVETFTLKEDKELKAEYRHILNAKKYQNMRDQKAQSKGKE